MLLHEGLGSVALWRDFPRAVRDGTGRRVVAFSRYGHGASDPPPKARTPRFMHEEALEVLPELRQRLKLTNPILLGHSDGASIALIHAANHPVRAVIAIAPHVFVEDVAIAEITRAKDVYENRGLRERMKRYHADVDAAFYGWNGVWLDPAFRSWDLRPELQRIEAPILLIQGIDDQYGTLAQLDAIETAATAPTRRVEIPGAQHQPHLERPAETLKAVTEFVTGLTRGGTSRPPAGRTRP